jgi:hypothetical protein
MRIPWSVTGSCKVKSETKSERKSWTRSAAKMPVISPVCEVFQSPYSNRWAWEEHTSIVGRCDLDNIRTAIIRALNTDVKMDDRHHIHKVQASQTTYDPLHFSSGPTACFRGASYQVGGHEGNVSKLN